MRNQQVIFPEKASTQAWKAGAGKVREAGSETGDCSHCADSGLPLLAIDTGVLSGWGKVPRRPVSLAVANTKDQMQALFPASVFTSLR